MNHTVTPSQSLATTITKKASKQTYYIIRFFVDRKRVADAYRAYAYFRWVDDVLDAVSGLQSSKVAFLHRQQALLEACYQGQLPDDLCAEEWMLADLVRNHPAKDSGLHIYLHSLMQVMAFDATRRGRLITQAELDQYSYLLAKAVSEAMFYFIGHKDAPPLHADRYRSVNAAHITHMLRDMLEDIQAGYFNIPSEYVRAQHMAVHEVDHPAMQAWVRRRVQQAHQNFRLGGKYLAHIKCWRCRLAGYAYTARFEWVLRAIERNHYQLQPGLLEQSSRWAGLWMVCATLGSMFLSPFNKSRI